MMLALVFKDGAARVRDDVPIPKVARGEALVAVHVAGVCSTDLEILNGYMGFSGVMGHEFVGRVDRGPRRWDQKRVVAEINCVCGRCDLCKAGLSTHCRRRTVLGIDGHDGVFAEYVSVPVRNLHEVPEAVGDDEAVFVEPLAAAFQIARQVKLNKRDEVVVLGDGRLGQLVARVMKLRVRSPLLVGKHAEKLEAAEKQGIQTRLLADFAPNKHADLVVDATGSPNGFRIAVATVRPRGTIVLKSTHAGDGRYNLTPLVVDEITVVGSRCGPFGDAIGALATGEIDVAALIGKRFPLSRAPEALAAAEEPANIKVLIDVRR